MIQTYHDFQTELASHADDSYRTFSMKGIPSERPFLGVRIPEIRDIVKTIPSDELTDFIKAEPIALEEVIARGMMICRLSYQESLQWFDSQIGYIDDWCNCDTFCAGYSKLIRGHEEEFRETKIDNLLQTNQEFPIRIGLVLLKSSYIKPDFLPVIFDRVETLKDHEAYYVRMAIAWLIAECFIKFPSATTGYLVASHLPAWTFNKAISKICDSYRVDLDTKALLRKMRKQNQAPNNAAAKLV